MTVWRPEHGSEELFNRKGADLPAGTAEDIVASVRSPGHAHHQVGNAFLDEAGTDEICMKRSDVFVPEALKDERGRRVLGSAASYCAPWLVGGPPR